MTGKARERIACERESSFGVFLFISTTFQKVIVKITKCSENSYSGELLLDKKFTYRSQKKKSTYDPLKSCIE